MVDAYFEQHAEVGTGPEARGSDFFQLDDESELVNEGDREVETVAVRQAVVDPEGFNEWGLVGWVDLTRSRELGRAVLVFDELRRL